METSSRKTTDAPVPRDAVLGRAPPNPHETPAEVPPAGAPMAEVERWHIRRALNAHGGNVSATARSLGINRSTVYRKILRRHVT